MIEISIIIPTYNRAERLRACLEALTTQTQSSGDFEVIVVIDGSTDHTRQLLATMATPYPLVVIWQGNQGQNVARNHGVAAARGRYCLLLDDDIIAEPTLVSEHLRVQRMRERVVGIGQITLAAHSEADWFTHCFVRGWQDHYECLNRGDRLPAWMDCYGGNMSLSRAAFIEAGGFDDNLRRSHDIELGYRLAQRGLSFVYVPNAIGNQVDQKGITAYAADAVNSGAAWVAVCQRHPVLLPQLLGGLTETSLRENMLRQILLALSPSPQLLASVGRWLGKPSSTHKWFRFLRNFYYWRGMRQALISRQAFDLFGRGVPILLYHAFVEPGELPGRFTMPVRSFARQMVWLKRLGYRVITLQQYLQYRRDGRPPPPRAVVLTIDDGYIDAYTLAYPILRRYDFPATVFLVSGRVGGCADWTERTELRGRRLLDWPQIKEMQHGGLHFGAHTRTHQHLVGMPADCIRLEVQGSKLDLEDSLKVPVDVFAFPYGEFDATVLAIVEQAGFLASCSTEGGLSKLTTPSHALRRIEIDGRGSLLRFFQALWLG